jgi:hypothetical protein
MARAAPRKAGKKVAKRTMKRSTKRSVRKTSSKRRAPMQRMDTYCSQSKSANACRYTPGCTWKKAPGRKAKICVRSKGAAAGVVPTNSSEPQM